MTFPNLFSIILDFVTYLVNICYKLVNFVSAIAKSVKIGILKNFLYFFRSVIQILGHKFEKKILKIL